MRGMVLNFIVPSYSASASASVAYGDTKYTHKTMGTQNTSLALCECGKRRGACILRAARGMSSA